MGKVVIARPHAEAVAEQHDTAINLADLRRWVGATTLDLLFMGKIPGSSRVGIMWIDDDGLRDPAVPANRKIRGQMVIAGTIVVCAVDEGQEVTLTDAEADEVLALARETWEILPEGSPKPAPYRRLLRLPG